MFKSRSFDLNAAVGRKAHLRAAAKQEWPFLSWQELSAVETETDLALLIQKRSGRTAAEAAPIVRDWMERAGIPPDFGNSSQTAKRLSDWESEGGATEQRRPS
ncbi:hypothetical protein [Devosia nitrariae]|uniref:Uncharacterized protein n=1 Tax=Devosia nitrariae TaxID=2071872 RepID=A0ABQ5W6M7_9HYPH|nr:hypothetical protein [Devosia nitrariae]GLQ55474.1 hypothetical protein GCM10010862_27330 [Devosia nitrariae]